jgi:hypothetical protein
VQPVGAVTVTFIDSPSTSKAFEPGEMVSVHGTPACDALKVFPAIVTVVLRAVPALLAVALSVTVPLPDPLAPAVTISHDALLVALQPQPDGAVTATLIASPSVAKAFAPGEIVSLQLMPACVALNVRPAIVTLPLRDAVPVLAAAVTVTVPLPEPPPVLTASQPIELDAVQVQPAGAVTPTSTDSPPIANAFDVGEIVSLHVRPAWLIVNVLPATVTVPLRDDDDPLAPTDTVTVPLPDPDAPVETVIQLVLLLVAVQPQPVPAVTVVLAEPPPAATFWLVGEIVGAQGAVKEKVFEGRLVDDPPGPIALTRPSYTMPPVSGVLRSDTKSTRIMPSVSSAGFPSGTVTIGVDPPDR